MKLTIGENIRTLRRTKDMTQEQLADRLGVTYQSVSRWENSQVYPDIELIPAIAELFGTSTDALLGVPETEKEKQSEKLIDEFNNATYEEPADFEKLTSLLRQLRRDFSGSEKLWIIWSNANRAVLCDPQILPELRQLVEAHLDKLPNDCGAIRDFAAIEDDEHIDAFLNRYSTHSDIGRNALLMRRYMQRGEHDKSEPLRQQKLFEIIDNATGNRSLYTDRRRPITLELCFAENTTRLNILHEFEGETPTAEKPITCGKGIDYWVETRIGLGVRRSCYLASLGKPDEAFTVLEDTVSLLEEVMKITTKIEFRPSRFTPDIIWTAEEMWFSTENTPSDVEERNIFIHAMIGQCFFIFPSQMLYALTSPRGWEWFDPIRNDPRYQGYIDRVKALVVTRPKNTFDKG